MDNRKGYEAWSHPVVEPFTKEQRQRLEALTLARKMLGDHFHSPNVTYSPVGDWIEVAEYIVNGKPTS